MISNSSHADVRGRADNVNGFYSRVPGTKPVNFRRPQRAGSCTANPMPRDVVDSQHCLKAEPFIDATWTWLKP
jgi:hypothetical protein